MKELLERIGLIEFFAYLCPGFILLTSLALWIHPDLMLGKIADQQLVLAILLIIASYALGLIIASWSSTGADHYIRGKKGRSLIPQAGPKGIDKLKWWWKYQLKWWLHSLVHRIPISDLNNQSLVEGRLRMAELLDKYARLQGLSTLLYPWDFLTAFRTMMAGRVGEENQLILKEAELVHRRLLFALGVALALLLVAMQAALRLLLWGLGQWDRLTFLNDSLPKISVLLLVLIALVSTTASFGLRAVASQWWKYELILTCSMTEVKKPPKKPVPRYFGGPI